MADTSALACELTANDTPAARTTTTVREPGAVARTLTESTIVCCAREMLGALTARQQTAAAATRLLANTGRPRGEAVCRDARTRAYGGIGITVSDGIQGISGVSTAELREELDHRESHGGLRLVGQRMDNLRRELRMARCSVDSIEHGETNVGTRIAPERRHECGGDARIARKQGLAEGHAAQALGALRLAKQRDHRHRSCLAQLGAQPRDLPSLSRAGNGESENRGSQEGRSGKPGAHRSRGAPRAPVAGPREARRYRGAECPVPRPIRHVNEGSCTELAACLTQVAQPRSALRTPGEMLRDRGALSRRCLIGDEEKQLVVGMIGGASVGC